MWASSRLFAPTPSSTEVVLSKVLDGPKASVAIFLAVWVTDVAVGVEVGGRSVE